MREKVKSESMKTSGQDVCIQLIMGRLTRSSKPAGEEVKLETQVFEILREHSLYNNFIA